MPDELSVAALQTLSDLKRQGVIPSVRSCCGQTYCQCPDAPHVYSLRDHAPDQAAYDHAIGTRLRVLTMPQHHEPAPPQCVTDPMICDCPTHQAERVQSIKRGSRDTRQPWTAAERAA